jgi:hypothetical protein
MKPMFWMVLGSGQPTHRHQSEQSARTEAERLARTNPGCEFYVLQAVAVCVKSDVTWNDLEDRDNMLDGVPIPF